MCPFNELVKSKSLLFSRRWPWVNWAPTCFLQVAKLPKALQLHLTFCVFKSHFQRRTLGQIISCIVASICCFNLTNGKLLKQPPPHKYISISYPHIFFLGIIHQERKCVRFSWVFMLKIISLEEETIKFILSIARILN